MTLRWQAAVAAAITASSDASSAAKGSWLRVGGGTWSSAWSFSLGRARYFVKVASGAGDALAAEADALRSIAATGTVRVPDVHACGPAGDVAYLVLEWLDLAGGAAGARLGRDLARMHGSSAPRFGWHRDNTIGATPQQNAWEADWAVFFRERRLRPQLELALANGHGGAMQRQGERLVHAVSRLLADHRPAPSLLHGDLWGGNAAALPDGTPVVYDPSSYYGDREADLAMSELFGGFGADFYAAYAEAAPLAAGYPRRRTLYNLYHVLNHLNLFGTSYLARAESMIEKLLR